MVGRLFDSQPLHVALGLPKTPKLWQRIGGVLLKLKILKQGCIDIRLILLLFQ